MEVDKLSSSRLTTFMSCGLKYYFRYIMGLVIPPNSALTLGTCVHAAIGNNMKQKIDSQEDLPEEDLLDYFSTVFDMEKSSTAWCVDEDADQIKDTGVRLVKSHRQFVCPTLQPIAVERGFIVELAKRKDPDADSEAPAEIYPPMEGWIDVVDERGRIIETKTTKNKPSRVQENHKLQATVYTAGMLSLGQPVPGARVDYLVKTKKLQAVSFDIKPSVADLKYLEYMIQTFIRGVNSEVFIPHRDFFGCTRRQCGYWQLCEEKAHGRVKD